MESGSNILFSPIGHGQINEIFFFFFLNLESQVRLIHSLPREVTS